MKTETEIREKIRRLKRDLGKAIRNKLVDAVEIKSQITALQWVLAETK